MKIRALTNKILCEDMERGELKTRGGIILMNDDATERGIRPRWLRVYSVGPEVEGIVPEQWVMVEHGRWSQGLNLRDDDDNEFILWSIEEESVLLVSDEKPEIERSESTAN